MRGAAAHRVVADIRKLCADNWSVRITDTKGSRERGGKFRVLLPQSNYFRDNNAADLHALQSFLTRLQIGLKGCFGSDTALSKVQVIVLQHDENCENLRRPMEDK